MFKKMNTDSVSRFIFYWFFLLCLVISHNMFILHVVDFNEKNQIQAAWT